MDTLLNKLTLTLVIVTALAMLCVAVFSKTSPIGESQAYMMTTIALENHFSQGWTDADYDQAVRDFPEHAWYFSGEHRNRYPAMGLQKDDTTYSAYFIYYSLAVIPIKWLLKYTGFSQSYAFAVTNVLVYILSLLVVYRYFGRDARQKCLTILTLACYPIPFYIWWASAEIFITAFVIMSIAFLYANKYMCSALALSVAGAMNITVMPFALFIVYRYATERYDTGKSWQENIRLNFVSLLALAGCFLTSLIHLVINKIRFGNITVGMPEPLLSELPERVYAYLFDINFGVLPYFPVLFLLILAFLLFLKNTRRDFSVILLSWFLVIFGFALHPGINCGMSGIHRYLLWSIVIPLMGIVWYYQDIRKKFKNITILIIVFSAVWSLGVTVYTKNFNNMNNAFTPVARFILDNYPQLYNPDFINFQGRSNWFQKNGPWPYISDGLYVKKILMKKEDIPRLRQIIHADEAFFDKLSRQLNDNILQYVSIKEDGITRVFFPADLQRHVGRICGDGGVCTDGRSGALLFGPYQDIKAGRYRLTVWGEVKKTKNAWVDFMASEPAGADDQQMYVWPLKHDDGACTASDRVLMQREFELPKSMHSFQVRVFVGEKDDIVIDRWMLTPIDDS